MTSPHADLGPDGLPVLPEQLEDRLYEILLDRPAAERPRLIEELLAEQTRWQESLQLRIDALGEGDRVLGRARQPLTEAGLPSEVAGYRIHGLLGEGGFGAVYRAEQHRPVHRIVALKVLHPQRLDERSQWRFQAERQTLARMQHAGIAQLYDAGSTAQGQLYFAMELVDGQPITRWCDEHRLGLGARLELFLRVCAAVQHAHQRGVVHRDLKPGNVLVKVEDGAPVPKVIDFGVAKVLADEEGDPLATREGALIGTPGYMSPEQAAGAAIDTRTDVYALGVLLYELLTGDLPFPRRLLTGRVSEVVRIVRDEDPRRLGTALRETTGDIQRIAACRGRSVPVLMRELRGDLEWIVRRALAKDPDARYGAVSDLIADVERYRRKQPVAARQHEAFYLLRRFVARHRLAVALSSTLVAATLVVIFGLWWSLGEVDSARRMAVERGDTAVREEYGAHLAAARAALGYGDAASAVHHLEVAAEPLRGWEWQYLIGQCDTSLVTIARRPESQLADIAWLGGDRLGGDRLALLHYDGVVTVCDPSSGTELGSHRIAEEFQHCCLDRARRRLFAIVDHHRRVIAVDIASWTPTTLFGVGVPGGTPATADIRSLTLTPDERTLAISDNTGAVVLLDVTGQRPPRRLCTARSHAWSMAFTPDGGSLALGTTAGVVEIRSVPNGELTRELQVHREGVEAIALSADGHLLFAAAGLKLHKIELASGELLQRIAVGVAISRLRLAADGQTLYGLGGWQKGRVMAWSTHTLELLGRFHGHRAGVRGLDLHPDGQRLASNSFEAARVWPTTPPVAAIRLDAGWIPNDLGVAPDGESFAVCDANGVVKLFDAHSLELEFEVHCDARLAGCALTDDTVYVAGDRLLAIDRSDRTVRAGPTPEHALGRLCLDDRARWLAASSRPPGTVSVWRLPELELVHQLALSVTDRIAYDRSRERFVCNGLDDAVSWIEPSTGAVTSEPQTEPGGWDAFTARDGVLAKGDEHLWIRDAGTDGFRAIGSATALTAVAIAPDLRRIVTGTADNLVTVWDREGTELLVLDDAPKMVTELAFVAGGQRLIGLSQLPGSPGYVMVWGAASR